MSKVLAALFGGAGAGLQSLGQSTFQEQEQRRREAAQEQVRVNTAKEQGAQRQALESAKQAERQREAQEAAALARSLGLEVPDNVSLTRDGVRLIADDSRAKAQAAAEAGRNSRFTEGMEGRMAQIERLGEQRSADLNARLSSMSDLNAARAEAARASAARSGQRKQLPTTYQRELQDLGDVYSVIRSARGAMDTPEGENAVGSRNTVMNVLLPSFLENKAKNSFDPGGVAVRARIGNVFSTIGKLRSGGAITESEFERLNTFLPDDGESADQVKIKLDNILAEYGRIMQRRLDTYGTNFEVPSADVLFGREPQEGAGGNPSRQSDRSSQSQFTPEYRSTNPFARRSP
jgi:hypothetical protein